MNKENNMKTTESKWENAAYIDESFREHLCEDDNPFDEALFGGRSYKEYDQMKKQIEQGALDIESNPFSSWFDAHDELNFFDGSIYLYEDNRMGRFGYHCDGEIVLSYESGSSYRYSLNALSRQSILYEHMSWSDCYPSNPDYPNNHVTSCVISFGYTGTSKRYYGGVEYSFHYINLNPVNAFGFWNLPFKVFDTWEHAIKYLYTGDETGLMYSPTPAPEYSPKLYLENFQMTVHDSSDFDRYYLAFSYNIPNDLDLDINSKTLEVKIKNQFDWEGYSLKGITRNYENFSEYGALSIDLKENPKGFNLYLDDFESIQNFFKRISIWGPASGDIVPVSDRLKRKVLGDGGILEDTSFSFGLATSGSITGNGNITGSGGINVPASAIKDITKSSMYLDCYVIQDGYKEGHIYSGSVDFLTGKNSMSSYTPDAKGDYTYNNDYKPNGHYYTDVSIDNQNNPVYNYYYIDIDNSKTQVDSSGVAVTTGSVVQNNTVTIPDVIRVILVDDRDSSGSENVAPDTATE